MNVEVQKRLHDVLDACHAVILFTAGKNFDDYAKDLLLRSAVERQFEIMGEALTKAVDEESLLTHEIPEINRIIGLRNRIIHGYDSVDDEIIWDIVVTKVQALECVVASLLSRK